MKTPLIYLSILVILQITTVHAQTGFVQSECGIDTAAPYTYYNTQSGHYASWSLYHNNIQIGSGGGDYSSSSLAVLMKFINDTTGFLIAPIPFNTVNNLKTVNFKGFRC
jgi:hypothetical protein